MKTISLTCLLCFFATACFAAKPIVVGVWPEKAPGETTSDIGTELPGRAQDNPPITRVEKITQPTLEIFPAANPSGAAVLILPGGGFRYVVPDLEGSEAAQWLGQRGITTIVLRYRTTDPATGKVDRPWHRPLQDSQRAMRLIRSQASEWKIDSDKVGLLGYSAGGQVAAIHLTRAEPAYEAVDEVDQLSFQPNFGILIYPWNIYDEASDSLMQPIQVTESVPPTFLVHTHDDRSSSLGAVMFYAGLKKANVSAELHVYQNGGHGYGNRPRENSAIGTWKDRCLEWMQIQSIGK